MEDPVVASDGHSYERAAIANVLSQPVHLRRSPLTREPLQPSVFTNRNLRKRIAEHQQEMVKMARTAYTHGEEAGRRQAAAEALEVAKRAKAEAGRAYEASCEAEKVADRAHALVRCSTGGSSSSAVGKKRKHPTCEGGDDMDVRIRGRRGAGSGSRGGMTHIVGADGRSSGGDESSSRSISGRRGIQLGRCNSTQCTLGADHEGLCSHLRVQGKRTRPAKS